MITDQEPETAAEVKLAGDIEHIKDIEGVAAITEEPEVEAAAEVDERAIAEESEPVAEIQEDVDMIKAADAAQQADVDLEVEIQAAGCDVDQARDSVESDQTLGDEAPAEPSTPPKPKSSNNVFKKITKACKRQLVKARDGLKALVGRRQAGVAQ